MSSDPKNYFGVLTKHPSVYLDTANSNSQSAFRFHRGTRQNGIQHASFKRRRHSIRHRLKMPKFPRASQHFSLCWFLNFVKVYCLYSSMLLIFFEKKITILYSQVTYWLVKLVYKWTGSSSLTLKLWDAQDSIRYVLNTTFLVNFSWLRDIGKSQF